MDLLMARAADDECLPAPHRHEFHPGGFLPPPRAVKVCELTDVVDLDGPLHAAQFAAPGQQALDDFAQDTQDRCGVLHCAYLPLLSIESPLPLCPVVGFPDLLGGT